MLQQPDDPSIADSDVVWRTWDQVVPSESGPRISSAAFKTDEDREISVDVAKLSCVEATFARVPAHFHYIAELPAGLPRSFFVEQAGSPPQHYTVYLWDDGTGNPAHAHIHPPATLGRSAYDKNAKKMAIHARVIVRPGADANT
jgi:hypothetical protein